MYNFVFPRTLLKRFIIMYRDQRCLWDRKSPAYKRKAKKYEAISKLTALAQEYDPTVTRVHVLRKIESLRACVRREYKRVIASRKKATNPDEIYTPQLWYYDLFSPIHGDEGQSDGEQAIESNSPEHASDSVDCDEVIIGNLEPSFEKREIEDYEIEVNNMVDVDKSPSITKRLCTEVEDEYDAIGINVAAKLRVLPSGARILAEKLINDVLYQAQVNGLHTSTVIYTPDPFKQDIL